MASIRNGYGFYGITATPIGRASGPADLTRRRRRALGRRMFLGEGRDVVGAADPFWQFASSFHVVPGMQESLGALRDDQGADVLLILLLLHAARRGQRLTSAQLHTLDSDIWSWRETIVRPLRTVRLALADHAVDGRDQLVASLHAAETQAERIQAEQLVHGLARMTGHAAGSSILAAAAANLETYRHYLAAPLCAFDAVLAAFASLCPAVADEPSLHH